MYKVIPATRDNKKTTLWGIIFGVLPDFASFTPIFLVYFWNAARSSTWSWGRPEFENLALANLTAELYNYTHSAIIWLVVFFIFWILLKKVPWILLGWGLHIGIDIFTHTKEFYATPFLFPLTDFKISVISWGHPVFMAVNYGLLILLYLFVIPKIKAKTLS